MKKIFTSQLSLFLVLVFFLMTGQGCFIKFRDNDEPKVTFDGGVYTSLDLGETWAPANEVYSLTGQEKLNTADVTDFIYDENNDNTLYLATASGGFYYTLDKMKGWSAIKTVGGGASDMAIDPKNECVSYATVADRIMKSTNCLRSFREMFHTDPRGRRLTSVAVDLKDSRIIYLASLSDLYRSLDGGVSWQEFGQLSGGIRDIKLRNVNGNQVIYVVTDGSYVYRSLDNGKEWKNLGENLKVQTRRSKGVVGDFLFDESGQNSLIYLSEEGIFRSSDGGDTWTSVNVISERSPIYSVAVSPKDANLIFYTTQTTFYRSNDNGVNWITKELPIGPRVAKKLVIDKINPNLMYLGAYQPPVPEK